MSVRSITLSQLETWSGGWDGDDEPLGPEAFRDDGTGRGHLPTAFESQRQKSEQVSHRGRCRTTLRPNDTRKCPRARILCETNGQEVIGWVAAAKLVKELTGKDYEPNNCNNATRAGYAVGGIRFRLLGTVRAAGEGVGQ